VIAGRIVAYRNANGPFITLEDIMKVSGIGEAKFAQFKEKITL
jgi:competence protein ComEA